MKQGKLFHSSSLNQPFVSFSSRKRRYTLPFMGPFPIERRRKHSLCDVKLSLVSRFLVPIRIQQWLGRHRLAQETDPEKARSVTHAFTRTRKSSVTRAPAWLGGWQRRQTDTGEGIKITSRKNNKRNVYRFRSSRYARPFYNVHWRGFLAQEAINIRENYQRNLGSFCVQWRLAAFSTVYQREQWRFWSIRVHDQDVRWYNFRPSPWFTARHRTGSRPLHLSSVCKMWEIFVWWGDLGGMDCGRLEFEHRVGANGTMQLKIWKIIYLNCIERYEQMIWSSQLYTT